MIRIFTLSAISLFFTATVFGQRVYVDNGSSNSYTLRAGDSLSIKAGTFRGSVNSWEQGVKIGVSEGAEFNPSSFGYYQGTLTVAGKATLPSLDGQNAKFQLRNFGRIVITGYTYLGNKAKLINSYGATIEFKAGLNSNKAEIENTGSILITGNWYLGDNGKLVNNNIIEVSGNLEFNRSEITNLGKIQSGGKLIFSQGAFQNSCKTIAGNGIEINSTNVDNNGLIWAKGSGSAPKFVNNGTIDGAAGSVVKAVDFENNGTIKGSGYFYFTRDTRHNSGTIGTNGNNGDKLYFYDATRSNSSQIFDAQSGTIRRSASFLEFAAPDTITGYPSCGTAFRSDIILPINWNYFVVNLTNNIPSLQWSSEQDNGTVFQVERSYNGQDFGQISTIVAANGQTKFSYNDQQVNTQTAIVYYRVRAIEPSGAEKISETRSVRFASNPAITLQAAPNPFNNQFGLSFRTDRAEKMTIRIFNLAGQLQVTKSFSAGNGVNSINVTEAANLNRGVYMVQLVNETGVVATVKVVKN
jgi:hypothetical protein